MNKKIAFYIILSLLYSAFPLQLTAQSNSTEQTGKNYLCCPETVFIHTDRDLYIAGENLLYKIYVHTGKELKGEQISSLAYIVLRDQKQNILDLIVKLNMGNSFGSAYLPDTLKTGIYELVGFTNFMKNYTEDIFFRKQIVIVNRFDKVLDNLYSHDSVQSINGGQQAEQSNVRQLISDEVQMTTERDSFKTRDKIKISINWKNKAYKKGILQASLSVKAINSLTTVSPVLNKDSIALTGELNNGFSDPYLPEKKGIYIQGKITTTDNTPLKEECLFITTFDSAANLQYAYSNDSGRFQFLLDNYYLGKNLVLKSWVTESKSADQKIVLDDKFELHHPFVPQMPVMNIGLKKYIYSSQDLVQIRKSYHGSENIFYEPILKTGKPVLPYLYFTPSMTVLPSNYIPLDDFQEISANILIGFILRKNKGKYNAYLYDNLTKSYFNKPALIFVDGMVIDNASQILSLNSDDIERIDLCKSLRMKGLLEIPGLVSITTKKKQPDFSRYNSSALFFRTENYSDKAYYRPISYSKQGSSTRLPDFRQLLFWKPDLELMQGEASTVEFNCSDYISEYLVELRGFTPDGKAVSAYTRFKVYR